MNAAHTLILAATVLVPADNAAVDHCELVGVLITETPRSESPFVPPETIPDELRTVTLVQECRIRTTAPDGTGTVIETRTVLLDVTGDDLAMLRDAVAGTPAEPDDTGVGLP